MVLKGSDKETIQLEEKEKTANGEKDVENSIPKLDDVPILEVENHPKLKTDSKEGREVQPKKIPIGGIQMPGFFTRSKSKEKCKEENEQPITDGAGLAEANENHEEARNTHAVRIKLPNPFRKSTTGGEEGGEKTAEPKEKRTLVDSFCLPISNTFQKKKNTTQQDLQNQTATAGLASMETLDETDKSADKKEDDMKEILLDTNTDEKKQLEKENSQDVDTACSQKIKSYRVVISAFLVFILLVIIIVIISLPSRSQFTVPIRDGRYVKALTSCGFVEGLVEDSAVAFRGIPYARQPIDDMRFKPSEPLNSADYCWNGTYLAHNATDYCSQIYSNNSFGGVESCLTLDVVTPHIRYDSPLPVIVLIGTESLIGGSPGKMRPSARYARSRDVIFVRPNFRLGVLGFLASDMLKSAVHPPTSGNYGLSDIIQALKWVQLNIEHFGGDRNSVTLFGHRAGATLVTALATTSSAKKLFARVWATSGAAIFPGKSLVEAEVESRDYVSSIPCSNISCLQQTDTEFLTTSIPDTWRKPQADLPPSFEDVVPHEWLVLDGNILKEDPAKVWAAGELPVQVVLGTTAHAGTTQILNDKYNEWAEDLVRKHVRDSKLGNLTDEIFKRYPSTYQGLMAIISDIRIVCPLLAIASQMHNVPFYIVTQMRGELNLTDIDSDIDAIFGRYEPKTIEQKRYISTIQQVFYHFVSHGTLPQMGNHSNKLFKLEQDLEHIEKYSHCDFWINKDIVPRYAQID